MFSSARSLSIACAVSAVLWSGMAVSQSGNAALGGFKIDASLPIEISADSLEVRQDQQTAVFTGAVDARQGEVRMQAERLTVTYDPESQDQGQAGAIRRVRADGSVFVSSAEGSAEGNWADYDVASGVITMGDTVTLTQGVENVLAGGQLRIDLNTGFASIRSGAIRADGSKERVQGLFFPAQK